jgi:hypothetical protein
MPRGAKLLSSDQLRQRNAKPHRIKARIALEQAKIAAELAAAAPPAPPPAPREPDPEAVAAYVAAVKREIETFSKRRVDGESLTRQYGAPYDWKVPGNPGYFKHGALYNFNEGTLLRSCRDYANKTLANPETVGTYKRELAERFTADLFDGAERGRYYDVEAAKNVERMLAVFADPENRIPWIRVLAMIEFACLKDRDGEFVLPAEELLNFDADDIVTQDKAILALQAAA